MRKFEIYNRTQTLKTPFFADATSANYAKLLENVGDLSDYTSDEEFPDEETIDELEPVEMDTETGESEEPIEDMDMTEEDEEETEESIISEMEETIEKFTELVSKFKELHSKYQEN